ncbi:MAG: exosortase H [Bacteroidetes bacterium]|nr:exosortase H [Bacteroidota bacterium]
MAYKIDKKRKNKPKATWPAKFRMQWLQKKPVLFFVFGFALIIVLFYWFYESSYYTGIGFFIISAYGHLSNFLLNLFGQHTQVSGTVISSPRFTISIAKGCDAIEGMALFTAALLSYPASWKLKLIGFLAGNVVLFLLNLVRIVSLFLTGIYAPKLFQIMHVEIWQALFILFAIALWIFWIRWAYKDKGHVPH